MDNEQLVVRICAGENPADNMLALWQQNKGFIHKMAVKYSSYAEIEDLKQEGYIGLCEAVRHYDPAANVPFINYAAFWIKQTMQRYIDNCGGVVRIPVHAREWIAKYKKITSEYRKYYGCEPTDEEMRTFLGVSAEKLENIKKSMRMGQIQSLDEPLSEEGESFLVDTVADSRDIEEDVIKMLDTAAMKKELWIAVDKLPKEQAEVIRKRYRERMTRKDTGEVLGITAGAVHNLESKAMRTLRMPHRYPRFKKYYEEYLSAHSFQHVGVENFRRTWTSEVEREVLREMEWEEERKRIMREADQVLLENA